MEKEQAIRLWEMLYGDREIAYDYASHPMYKNDFRNSESEGGWDVDYKQPLSKNGNTSMYNFIPTSILTKAIRDERTVFKIGNFLYEVRKGTQYGSFHIFDVTDRSKPVDMEPNNQNQDPDFNQERLKRSLARKEEKAPDYAKELYAFRNQPINFEIKKPINDSSTISSEQIEKLKEISSEATAEVENENQIDKTVEEQKDRVDEIDQKTLEIEELKKQITNLKIELSDKEHDIAELNDRLLALDNKVEAKEQSGDLQQEMTREEETSEIVETDEESEKLKAENERLTSEISEKEQEIERINNTLYSTVNKLNQLQENQTLIENENGNLKGKLAAFEDDRKTLDSYKIIAEQKGIEIASLKQKVDLFNDKLNQKEEETKAISDRLSELEKDLDVRQKEVGDLNQKLNHSKELEANLNKQIQELSTELERTKKDNEALNEYKAETTQKENESENRFLDINAQKAELETRLQSITSEKDGISKRLEALEAEKAQNAHNIEELQKKISELEDINAQKNEELNRINTEKSEAIQKFDKQLELNNSENEKYQKTSVELEELKNKFQELAPLKAKVEELNAAIDLVNQDTVSKERKIQQLLNEKADLNKIIDELKNKNLTDEKEYLQISELKKESDANLLEYQNQIEDLTKINNEKETALNELQQKLVLLKEELNKNEQEKAELIKNNQLTDEDKAKLSQSLSEAQSSIVALTSKYNELNDEFNDVQNKYQSLVSEKEELLKKEEAISQENIDLQNSKQNLSDELTRTKEYLFMTEQQISITKYDEVKTWLSEKNLSFDKENLKKYLDEHPEAKISDRQFYDVEADSLVLEENLTALALRKQKAIKAKEFYQELYGSDNDIVDFSGREIKFNAYGDKKSKYGWNYVLYDEKKEESPDNVLIANIKSLADFKRDSSFITNGHSFIVSEIGGKPCVTSQDFVTDPYNFSQALQVSENQIKQKSHLIYIFIRLIGASLSIIDKNSIYKFVDIIDKTAKKCCPKSFIDMQVNIDSNMDYISIIFDGENDDAYREATEYAILINSYRRNFYDLNMLNAIIILDEIEVPYTLRHVTFKELITKVEDQGLTVIKYDLLHKIINSTIKRTIHVGKQIKDKIGEYQNSLRPSTLARGEFAEVYHNDYSYNELNLIYNLRRKAQNLN